MDEAFKGADIVYPKSWAPYEVMQKRVPLLHAGDQAGLKELEKACLANNAKFKDWECTEEKMKLTKGGARRAVHALPPRRHHRRLLRRRRGGRLASSTATATTPTARRATSPTSSPP